MSVYLCLMPNARLGDFRGIWASGITSGTKTSERGGCTVPVLALMLAALGLWLEVACHGGLNFSVTRLCRDASKRPL